jgi:hypothetical protein
MITLKQIQKVSTLEDLENLGIGEVYYDISYRGGGLGFCSSDVAEHFGIEEYDLPGKFGAGCNYLGGGLRGSIFPSTFSDRIEEKKAKLLRELADACVRVYEYVENGCGMNDEEGNTNWDAKGTNACRDDGIISAY